ncbi:MAG: glycogen synthase GlgA [Anaerolineales bacterium]
MKSRLNIVMIASECVPYVKTGGLADVVGALPKALRTLGHNVMVVIPKYSLIDAKRYGLQHYMNNLGVWMGDVQEWCAVYQTDNEGVAVYFIEFNHYFDRLGCYHDGDNNDYLDNDRRFGFLTRAALQLCHDIGFEPDIVHAHDWQAALAPAYLKIWHWNDPILGHAASVLTIHNIAYQGVYPASNFDYLGLQWDNFTPEKFEDHGKINFLKGGIQYADMVNTVSPTYAIESRIPEYAHGLAPFLNDKGNRYLGILNGADYEYWNPETDRLIPANFSYEDLSGKAVCKEELQKAFLLKEDPSIPVIGAISRFADQKGLNLLAQAIEEVIHNMAVQFAILGSGDKGLEYFFGGLPARYPGQVGSYIGYNEGLSHLIEAGSDFFIMPSIFEPCGLNQMYSLKYGTLPIVRATGGLDDTVEQYREEDGSGTGFKFWEPSANAVYYSLGWAVSTYFDRPDHIKKMMRNAMAQDFSWEKSAREYLNLYERAIQIQRS